MCWRGVYRASFQTQSALGAPTLPSSGALLPTNCRCRKRRLGLTTSAPAVRASRTSPSSVEKRQANGVEYKCGWPLLRFCFSRSADGCCCELDLAGATETAVLDLRDRSVVRGQNPSETGQAPLEIPRTAKHLVLDLPIGSKEGPYDVGLFTETGDQILRATGTAQLQ